MLVGRAWRRANGSRDSIAASGWERMREAKASWRLAARAWPSGMRVRRVAGEALR